MNINSSSPLVIDTDKKIYTGNKDNCFNPDSSTNWKALIIEIIPRP